MNLNSIMIGTENPKRLVEYYTKLFGEPAMVEDDSAAWEVGTGTVSVGSHDQVTGRNAHPGRMIFNIESADVQGDFDRFKAAGATVVREPYTMGEGWDGRIATFSDPDDNYFQLMSPWSP